jgi:putative sterol carrier protein
VEKTVVRNFKDEDLGEIVNLFEDYHIKLAGFIPRTPETWKYLILDRPGISKDGIFVARLDENLVGYIVVGFKTMQGAKVATIYELCAKNMDIASKLLEVANNYAYEYNADYVLIQPPPTHNAVHECLRQCDFVKINEPATKIMVTLINPTKILEVLAEIFNERNEKDDRLKKLVRNDRKVLIKAGENYVTLHVQEGKIRIKSGKEKGNMTLEMTPYNFLRIFLGLTSPLKAYLTGKLKIKGMLHNVTIFKLIKALQAHYDFYFPLTEHF